MEHLGLFRILGGFVVLEATLPLGGSLLGRRFRGCGMGIAEGKSFFQPLLRPGGQHPGILLHLRDRGNHLRCQPNDHLPLMRPVGIAEVAKLGILQQRAALPAADGSQQHPVAGAADVPHQPLIAVGVHLHCHLLQLFLRLFHGVGHDEPILGAGHGNIEHTHLLRQAFRGGARHDRPLGKSCVADALVAVGNA